MKFLIVATAVFAVAVAGPTKRAIVQPGPAGPAPIIDLDQLDTISVGPAIIDNFEPIAIGPAIIDNYEPVAIGPPVIDFPLPEGGIDSGINPTPAGPSASAPLVQIILNINSASNVVGTPVAIDTPLPAPTPVQVVEEAEVIDSIIPEPVIVVDEAIAPEGVIVAQPIIPGPTIVLPDILN